MNNQTLQQMKLLRLYGMHGAFTTTLEATGVHYTNDELIAFLIQAEWDDKHNRKIERLTKSAKFRYKASAEEIVFNNGRSIDKNQLMRFISGEFIKNKENILITGSTGVGKSFIASALGYQACSLGYRVKYYNINKLFGRLKSAKADGSYLKEIDRIEKQDLIILDDFGLQQLDNTKRQAFMEIIEDRHGKKSTIIASQLPVVNWHEIIGEQTIADAILDRLAHSAHRIDLKGESMRKKRQKL
jgi:DNA replication protein DnaC